MGKQLVAAAPGSSGIDYAEYLGKLFVFEPLEVEKGISTVHGPKDATRGNVYVLLGTNKTEDFEDALVFPLVLQGQLRKAIGRSYVVGRLEQLPAQPGKKPAWHLADPTPADMKKAAAWQAAQSLGVPADDEDDEGEDSF